MLIGLTETSLAIIPGAGGTLRLTRLIGLGRAKQMIFTADRVDAIKAYEYGILEEVFPKQDFLNQVITYANKIIHNGPLALQFAKQAINQGIDMNLKIGRASCRERLKMWIVTCWRKKRK